MEFMNSGKIPDFLSSVVMMAIDHACDHVGFSRPQYEKGFENDDLHLLANLCRRTRMLTTTELEMTEAALARHIIAIVNHPKCPNSLYSHVADFVTDGTNLKNSSGESLVDRWAYAPETVTAVVEWANEADDNKEIAAELTARANAAGGAQ